MGKTRFFAACLCAASFICAGAAADVPSHPSEIEFEPLEFDPPKASEYRHEVAGVPVYLAPSHEFPLINISFTFRGGSYLEPDSMTGLASATGAMIRRGGSASMSAEDLDEEFDFLAAQVGTNAGDNTAGASMNALSSNFDRAFELFMEMLREPRFQQDRFQIYKDEVIERMRQRNDDASPILSREWSKLMYGPESHVGEVATIDDINNIEIDDMREFHRHVFQPGNLIIGVSGDFNETEMLAKLESALGSWARGDRVAPPPAPSASFDPGVYHVEKDIPQGKVNIGMRGVERDHPDAIPLDMMNFVLGGSGFTSRITKKVRSDEGLAYSAGSGMIMSPWYPGEFRASVQSKNRTVALSIKLILDEIERIRSEPISDEELETAKNSLIETFPRAFESKAGMVNLFVTDEWTDRPDGYWETYRDKVRAVTKDDILRVAKEHLDPNQMAIMVVGKWEEIAPGDLEGRASMDEFFDGRVTHKPLLDPLTQEPIEE